MIRRLSVLLTAALSVVAASSLPAQLSVSRRNLPAPLARAAAVRAEIARRGLPPMGRASALFSGSMFRAHVVPGHYNVKFRSGTSPGARAALRSLTSARVLSELPEIGVQTIAASDAASARYRRDPKVQWIEPDAMRYPLLNNPNDTFYNSFDTNLPSDPSNATWYKWDAHLIGAVDGWSLWPGKYFSAGTKGAAAVKIAIIDTGVDYTHPDFINAGGTGSDISLGGQLYHDTLDRTIFNGLSASYAPDGYGHGTHVTGIAAAATNNGQGVTGNGYNANVISLRVTDDSGNGTASDLARAIIYAAQNGAVVANISLGDYSFSQAEQDAVNYAWGLGMLVVAAAGNDGGTGVPPTIYPAALSRVLSVSATSRIDSLASYSSYGDWVGISAPGGDFDYDIEWFLGVYSTTPTYYVTLNSPDFGLMNTYDYLQGTSMASPQVAGAAALYAGQHGWTHATRDTPLKIWQALQQSADPIDGTDGWNPYYGWGRVNIYNLMNLDNLPNPRGDMVGNISGQVRYRDTVVQNANIVATPVGDGDGGSISSRSDGGYRIANITTGVYDVSATYFGETQTIKNVVVKEGCDTPGIDFDISAIAVTISRLTVSPASVLGPHTATGTITLSAPAPEGGLFVKVTSSNPSAAYLANPNVHVVFGSSTSSFVIYTKAVTNTTNVTFTASAPNMSSKTASLTVRANTVTNLSISPNPVVSSLNTKGTVTLEASAGAGGVKVDLSSSAPALATFPVSSVVVPQGASSATFTISTTVVTSPTSVDITATANGASKTTSLTVRGIGVYAISLTPNPVTGGNTVTGSILLEAAAAPGDIVVTLRSNSPYAALPVTSITVAAGQMRGAFTINTTKPPSQTTATISAYAASGVTRTKLLTIR